MGKLFGLAETEDSYKCWLTGYRQYVCLQHIYNELFNATALYIESRYPGAKNRCDKAAVYCVVESNAASVI